MEEDRVVDEIRRIIDDREKTDKKISFWLYFVILLIISIYTILALYYTDILGYTEILGNTDVIIFGYSELLLLGFISVIVFFVYVWYLLIKREDHFKRERKLLSNLILWFEDKVEESRINLLKSELRDRENKEIEKNPILWSISILPFLGLYFYYFLATGFYPVVWSILTLPFLGPYFYYYVMIYFYRQNLIIWPILMLPFLGLYFYYFLMIDFYRHDKREEYTLRDIHDAMESTGIAFLIPSKYREIPKRNIILYTALTLLTGVFGIYWFYLLFKDPNVHFEYQKEWEDKLLEAFTTKSIIPKTPIMSTGITGTITGTTTKTGTMTIPSPANAVAALILPGRMIDIIQDETLFGRNDFENDISKEYIKYITKRDDGRYHFKIIKQGSIFYIEDAQSRNGTMLNNLEIKSRGMTELKNDDKIIVAGIKHFIITFKILADTTEEFRS